MNNHVQALSDPVLIRDFPDPNNPNILDPEILNLFESPNPADLTREFRNNIQLRVKDKILTLHTVEYCNSKT